jgi:hypothetical protein
MPYCNPEDKRRWEREHRPQRNEIRRRRRRSSTPLAIITPNSIPDPTIPTDSEGLGNIIAIGTIVLTVGLLLVMITIWKARKRRACFSASARPATHEGGSNE